MSWSSGKDSAFALYVLSQSSTYEVTGLFTTVTEAYARVSMHGVREVLLDQQAARLGLPLYKAHIPAPCPNKIYEEKMAGLVQAAQGEGVEAMAFGDLFLEDIRAYRIQRLEGTGIEPLFPIWGWETGDLAQEMLRVGLGTVITCVDEKKLLPTFSGRRFDEGFLSDLPEDVDPCGENGEFHSFVYNHPLYSERIPWTLGERVSRDGFTFADVLPAEAE